MPNMEIAPNSKNDSIEIFYDAALKNLWGIRKIEKVIRDGVYIEAVKSITMNREQLEQIIEQAKTFVRERS